MNPIYLDYNATTPVSREVVEAMMPFLETHFGNPSSMHAYGVQSRLAIEDAREHVAILLGCEPSEVVFTSGGTESNNYAIKGAAMAQRHKGKHIITSAIEHPAVTEVCKYLEKQGFDITYLPVDEYGLVSPSSLQHALRQDTILVTIMHANNEVGTIQPIGELSAIAGSRGILFHTDAAQSAGKIPTRMDSLGVDLLSIAGHKIYAPKGVGALFIGHGTRLEKMMHGADHEQNLRAGTENVHEIVGLGKACEIAYERLEDHINYYRQTRDRLFNLLKEGIPELRLNGHPEKHLPNTLSVSFPGVEANTLLARLEGVAASAGAACHAERIDLSAVLEAMHIPVEYAMGTIRFSTGRTTTQDEIEKAAREVIAVARDLMPGQENVPREKKLSNGQVKLTQYTHGLGCACKIAPEKLEKVLQSIPSHPDARVLVGTETSDDAAVYEIDHEQALVQTLDFFTPIVDDPYDFGAIAAANALSDIYAMGASPIFAMNIVGFPEETLPMEVLHEILRGAHDKAREAGIPVLGGHTIDDPEPKYGMVASGLVDPGKIWKNSGAIPGDLLILTKPIGTGILTTGLKRGLLSDAGRDRVTRVMSDLNKKASELMRTYSVHACTDITGFGLLGHLREMAFASECNAEIWFSAVPVLEETEKLVTAGVVPGGTQRNLSHVQPHTDFGKLNHGKKLLLADAQTSGGLLLAIPRKEAASALERLKESGLEPVSIIGRMTQRGTGNIMILKDKPDE